MSAIKFFKRGGQWIAQDWLDEYEVTVPMGLFKREIFGSNVSVVGFNTDSNYIIKQREVTKIEKNDDGDKYVSVDEFIEATTEFFDQFSQTMIVNDDGGEVTPITPFMTSNDEIYVSDIDWENSDFTGWSGEPKDLFGNINNGGIFNDSSETVKTFTLKLKRTRKARDFGIGTSIGSIRNLKATLLGSGGAERGIMDNSDDSSPKQSMVYSQEEFVFNGVRFEFLTSERIDVTNLFIKYSHSNRKQNYIHKFGMNHDIDSGLIETIWTLGDKYVFTETPQPYYISSSNNLDNQIIRGEVLVVRPDGKYQRHYYEVSLQGNTPVQIPTLNGYNCVASNRAYNADSSELLGDVYIYENTATSNGVPTDLSKVRSVIEQGREQTEQAVYTVPEYDELGRTVYAAEIYSWSSSAIRNRSTAGVVDLKVAPKGGTLRVQSTGALSDNFITEKVFGENTPLMVGSGSDVSLEVSELSLSNVAVTGSFLINLIVL